MISGCGVRFFTHEIENERLTMNRSATVNMLLFVLFLGIAIGIFYVRWMKLENLVGSHDSRLAVLEADHAERLKFKACAKTVWALASRFISKATFGLVKIP